MTSTAGTRPQEQGQNQVIRNGWLLRLSTALWRRPWARASLLLTPPLAWFLLVYIASLVVLLVTAFWTINPFTSNIEQTWTLSNFKEIFTTPAYLSDIGETVGMDAAVTVTDAGIAF